MTLSVSYGALKSTHGVPVEKSRRERTPAQQAIFKVICRLWAKRQGFPKGRWPKARIYDVVLISQFAVQLEAPVEFWKQAITATPIGASFTWLTTGPNGRTVSRLEEWHANWRVMEWKKKKSVALEDDGKSLAAVMARVLAQHPDVEKTA